jgi:hypothetical protein
VPLWGLAQIGHISRSNLSPLPPMVGVPLPPPIIGGRGHERGHFVAPFVHVRWFAEVNAFEGLAPELVRRIVSVSTGRRRLADCALGGMSTATASLTAAIAASG